MIKYIFLPKIYINLKFKKLIFAKLNYILMAIKKFHYNFSIVCKDVIVYTPLFVIVCSIIANQILLQVNFSTCLFCYFSLLGMYLGK